MLIGLKSLSYPAHWNESLAPTLLLMHVKATWTRLGPANGTPLGWCKHRCVLSTEPPALLPQTWRRSSLLSASIRKLVGKKRCPLPMIRTTGGRKEPSGWRKERSRAGQLGGSGGIDKISSVGHACKPTLSIVRKSARQLALQYLQHHPSCWNTCNNAGQIHTHGCTSVSLE